MLPVMGAYRAYDAFDGFVAVGAAPGEEVDGIEFIGGCGDRNLRLLIDVNAVECWAAAAKAGAGRERAWIHLVMTADIAPAGAEDLAALTWLVGHENHFPRVGDGWVKEHKNCILLYTFYAFLQANCSGLAGSLWNISTTSWPWSR